ncbi:MAG: hypothetical protein WKF81_08990 [Thermomicrobiales bacterium]
MIDEVRHLLEFIVRNYVVRDEVRTIDRDASIIPDGKSIEEDKQHAVRRESDHARALGDRFEDGLVMAWHRYSRGGVELLLDDRNEADNAVADALIQLLVRFDLATSRTEETDPLHYAYYVTVDWDRLYTLATAQGIELRGALEKHTAGVDAS